jgi:uncharacterized protein YfaT (DUF1175 family)
MRVEKWKQIFIETPDGQVIAIEEQRHLYEIDNLTILQLRDKPGWWWIEDCTGLVKTNGQEVMRVHVLYHRHENWYDKLKKKIQNKKVHHFR